MGSGGYSVSDRKIRSVSAGYATKSAQEIFPERNLNSAMSPYGLKVRESRDSAEHPASRAITLGLDVTGSMGSVPHYLVKEGLPVIMDRIIKHGIKDPQLLFLGIGDHTCDVAPIQVGQFESSDALLDKWLTTIYLEGHGGGNDGESYMLAWYVAAKHTSIDCFEKRKEKGFLFTVGDEPVLPHVDAAFLQRTFGPGQYGNVTSAELLEQAMKTYNVYHINVCETSSGSRRSVETGWRQLLHDHLLMANRREDVVDLIVSTVTANVTVPVEEKQTTQTPDKVPPEKVML